MKSLGRTHDHKELVEMTREEAEALARFSAALAGDSLRFVGEIYGPGIIQFHDIDLTKGLKLITRLLAVKNEADRLRVIADQVDALFVFGDD